jgi:hypothetical protein
MAGDWIVVSELAEEWGIASTSVSSILGTARHAGLAVEDEKLLDDGRTHRYRVKRAVRRVTHESAGVTHPQLGSTLTVRALVIESDGSLVMQLSNGTSSWACSIVAHVEH